MYYCETGVTLSHETPNIVFVVNVTDGLNEIKMPRVADKYSTYRKS